MVVCQAPVSIDYRMQLNADKLVWIQTVITRIKTMTLNSKVMATPHFQNLVRVKRGKKKANRVKRRRKKKMNRVHSQT